MSYKRVGWKQASWSDRLPMIAMPLIFFLFGAAGLYRGSRDLQSLSKVQGIVETSAVRRGSGKTNPYEVVFRLRGQNDLLGVYQGQDQASAQALQAVIQPRDSLTVYYDSTGVKAGDVNLHVYQIEKGVYTLLSLEDTQHRELTLATLFFSGGLIFAILEVIFFWTGIFTFPRA